jgi:iron-sulfur cluster assembly protein
MFQLTPAATQEILASALRSDAAGMALRVAARQGPDGAIEYGMGFDEVRERDESLQFGDLTVLMGAPSRELLASTVLDLVETAPGELNFVFSRIDPADGEHQGDGEAGQSTPGVCGSGCGCGS